MRLRDQLLTVSEAYAKVVERSEARISTIVYGSGNAISRLRDGADMGSERIHNGLQWFSEHWPNSAPWPTSVPRPGELSVSAVSASDAAASAPSERSDPLNRHSTLGEPALVIGGQSR